MVIYIESVIINNLVINMIILYFTSLFTKRRCIWWQSIIGAGIGAAYALLSPLIMFKGNIIIKILLSLIICLVSTRYSKISEYFVFLAVFYAITFFIGGCIIGIANLNSTVYQAIYNPNNISLAVVMTVVTVLVIATKALLRRMNISKNKNFEIKVMIKIGDEYIEKNGYLDSGNNLYYKGLYPIVVVDHIVGVKASGKIKVKTVNANTEMSVYQIKTLKIDGKDYRNIYAIEQQHKSKHEIILHSSMI